MIFFIKKKKYQFIKKISKNIDTFIDVGSHHGKTIEEFLNILSIKRIYGFEPSEKNYLKLKKKIEKIKKTKSVKINIYQLGIGDKEGTKLQFINTAKLDINSEYFKENVLSQLYLI